MKAKDIKTMDLEPRLQARYELLVHSHLENHQPLAAGQRTNVDPAASAKAVVQAASRFYNNPAVHLPALAEPLLDCARKRVLDRCNHYALVAEDYSNVHYNQHTRKGDRMKLSHKHELGYELHTSLLISDQNGQPLAPLCQELRSRSGLHSTRSNRILEPQPLQDGLTERMAFVESLDWGLPLVHLTDREFHSVAHLRCWDQNGWLSVVRAKSNRVVAYAGDERSIQRVAQNLRAAGQMKDCREVLYRGRLARQWVGETTVILNRPAKPRRRSRSGKPLKRAAVAGPPLQVRLIVSDIYNEQGRRVASWYLLSNVPAAVSAETIALWYYWRWKVESFFRLLKGAGQQMEEWQQEHAEAIARRLLVASMACVLVWNLEGNSSPEAEHFKEVLMRLGGRQRKHRARPSAPALLAGLSVLLPILVLPGKELSELRNLGQVFLEGRLA
jgi:hypothetical protein